MWRVEIGNSTYLRLYAELRGYFERRLKGWGDPSDLVMKVWVAAGRYYRGDASLRYYLFTVARGVLVEHWRSFDRMVDVASGDFDVLVADLPADAASADSVLDRENRRVEVQRAVHRLHEPFRQTLRLKLEDMDDTQVAAVTDVPRPTARSRLRRGLRHLKAELV